MPGLFLLVSVSRRQTGEAGALHGDVGGYVGTYMIHTYANTEYSTHGGGDKAAKPSQGSQSPAGFLSRRTGAHRTDSHVPAGYLALAGSPRGRPPAPCSTLRGIASPRRWWRCECESCILRSACTYLSGLPVCPACLPLPACLVCRARSTCRAGPRAAQRRAEQSTAERDRGLGGTLGV